jgi:hypothetical protein
MIRIIIDDIEKYNYYKNILPNNIFYIYNPLNNNIENKVKYNLFIDIIQEKAYELCPSKYNILLVNDEYITINKYLRREKYIDKPLILIDNVVKYYFCSTLYSKKYLIKHTDKNKIIYLNGLIYDNYNISLPISNKQKYILYDIDLNSKQDNLLLLKIWQKHYISRPEILIIVYKNKQDICVKYNYELYKKSKYKNIIMTNNLDNLDNLDNSLNIYASIINNSYYSLNNILNENILKNRIIITLKNDITKRHKNLLLMDIFDEHNICKCLNILFNYNNTKINNIINKNNKILHNNIIKTQKILNKLFNIKLPLSSSLIEHNKLINKINISYKEVMKLIIDKHKKIENKMKKINNKFKKKIYKDNYLDKYYHIIKKAKNKTDYCYATIIFLDNKYISSILTTGYIMKYINKTKYNLICFVQNKPSLDFPGITEKEINDIGLFYDCIIGIDLLYLNLFNSQYKNNNRININYYVTKVILTSFITYKKIIYYDSSSIIQKNIDYYFLKYNENKYYNIYNSDLERGLVGNLYMFEPKIYYIDKAFYLINNFLKYFDLKHYTPDETIIFYTLYPNWSNIQINQSDIKNNSIRRDPYINMNNINNNNITFNMYVIYKPFLYNKKYKTFFLANHTCYQKWDEAVKLIIIKYPELYKYFEFIKTFRYTLF